MSSCPGKNDLIAYCLGMLGQKERKLIEEHIAICQHCRQAIQVEIAIDKELSTRMDPGNIEDTILQRLQVYRELRTTSWWAYPLYVLLNTLAGFGLAFGIWIFIGNLIIDRSFSYPVLGNNIDSYIGIGLSVAVLLASFGFAFRRDFARIIRAL